MRATRRAGAAAALLGASLIGIMCALRPGRLLVVPLAAPAVGVSYDHLASLAAAEMVPRVAAVVADTLGVALPEEVTGGLYRSRSAFTSGLVHDVGLSPRLALELSGRAIGFALPRTVLLLTGERVAIASASWPTK
jgi:hypothetical protein